MGNLGHLLSPVAEQDAYPLNGTPVTRRPNISSEFYIGGSLMGVIAVDNHRRKVHLVMACWERWECDFAVEHKHRELKPPRTFAPKFGGLWLMRRKHWFELWGQIRRSRGTAQIPLWCIFGLQVTRNWKPEAKLEPKLFSFREKSLDELVLVVECYPESGEIAFEHF